mgnify:CR=1 FL=1
MSLFGHGIYDILVYTLTKIRLSERKSKFYLFFPSMSIFDRLVKDTIKREKYKINSFVFTSEREHLRDVVS